jgi:dihydroorotate dehydrogenase
MFKLLTFLPPESAHWLAMLALKLGFPVPRGPKTGADKNLLVPFLGKQVFPFGVAAGVCKNAEGIASLRKLGFGFAEVGSVLAKPWGGNHDVRVKRWSDRHSMFNRLGLPSQGYQAALKRIRRFRHRHGHGFPVLVNLALVPGTSDVRQLSIMAQAFARHVDAIVINISCPNTTEVANAVTHIAAYIAAVREAAPNVPLLLKLGPTATPADMLALLKVARQNRANGVVLLNTTPPELRGLLASCFRPHLKDWTVNDKTGQPQGGFSGPAAFANILASVRLARRHWPEAVIVATGAYSGSNVVQLLQGGANVVETNGWLTRRGPGVVAEAQRAILEAGGPANLQNRWRQTA